MAADLGVSLDCALDYTPTMASVSGVRSVENAIIRRLSRSTGTLWYDRSYGRNLCDFVNQSGVTRYEIEQAVEAEALEEERAREVDAVVRANASIFVGHIELTVSGETNVGPFEFVLDITAVKVDVLRRK